jgi:hypothetical protein
LFRTLAPPRREKGRKNEREDPINKIRDVKGDITTDTIEVQKDH